MAAKDGAKKEGFRASGQPDMRTEAERSRGADDMVKVDLRRTYRVGGKTYHPGEDVEVPKSLAAALCLTGKQELPVSDERRERPEATGGPDVKDSQAAQRAQQQAAAGQGNAGKK